MGGGPIVPNEKAASRHRPGLETRSMLTLQLAGCADGRQKPQISSIESRQQSQAGDKAATYVDACSAKNFTPLNVSDDDYSGVHDMELYLCSARPNKLLNVKAHNDVLVSRESKTLGMSGDENGWIQAMEVFHSSEQPNIPNERDPKEKSSYMRSVLASSGLECYEISFMR